MLYEKYEKLLKERGDTTYRVCKSTGLSTSTMTDWKMGRYTPKIDKLMKLANYFGVPIEYFLKK